MAILSSVVAGRLALDLLESFSGVLTSAADVEIVSAANGLGKTYLILFARVVRESGATTLPSITLSVSGDTILDVSPVTFEGTLIDYEVVGEGISITTSGTGNASYAISIYRLA